MSDVVKDLENLAETYLEQLAETWRRIADEIQKEAEIHKLKANEKAEVYYSHADQLKAAIAKLKKESTK